MSTGTVSKHIEAEPGVVFEAITDFVNAEKRIEAIRKVEMLTDGPVGVGTRFRETRVLFDREGTEELKITAFDPPHSYTVECENHGCRFLSEIRITPSGSGTEIEMSFEAVPVSFLAKAMSGMIQEMMDKMLEVCGKDLDDLKTAIESG